MDGMSGGFLGRFRRGKTAEPAASSPHGPRASEPAIEPAPEADDDAVELHFCCICGAMLGFDFEDEVNGEGAGRDICGACNRTKNDEALFGR